jgi:hypothetical protein
MQFQNEKNSVAREDSVGGFLAELGFDIVGDLVPDSVVGYIVLILAVLFVAVIRSAMND